MCMKKKSEKNHKKFIKMSLLNFNFVMIYIIHNMLVLLKNHLSYVQNSTFKCFCNE